MNDLRRVGVTALAVLFWLAPLGAALGQDVQINVGDLPPGKTLTITFQATVDSPVAAGVEQVANQGSVDGNFATVLTDDPDVGGAADPTVTDIAASPDLTIAKDDGGFVAMPGDTVVYTLTFGNDGAGATQDAGVVTITETVPIGTTFNEAASGGAGVWSCADGAPGGTVCTHAAGAIGAGVGGLTVDFAVDVDDPFPAGQTELDNTATIADVSGEEANPADNTANDVTPVITDADLSVEKSVDEVMPIVGETVTFTVKVTNNGPAVATGVEITDLLPSGLDYVSDVPSQGTYDDLTGVWDFGATTLGVGAMATLEITATVNPGMGDPGGTGAFIDAFVSAGSGGLSVPESLEFGPDGNLYVASWFTHEVLRYSGTTGAFIDAFVSTGSGGLTFPHDLGFGPDGHLYVASNDTDEVLRYDGTSGAFIDAFVTAGSGGLDAPLGLEFGPDGNLYVASFNTHEVLRYSGMTGAFVDAFVTAGSGGLVSPTDLEFGPDGNLYVPSPGTGEVLRYDGASGAFIDAFVSVGSDCPSSGPELLKFGPAGNLYLSCTGTDEVLRYDGGSGAFIDAFVSAGSGGLNASLDLGFGPDGNLYVASGTDEVLRYDGFLTNTAEVTALVQTDPNLTNNQASQGIDYKSADYGDAPDVPGGPAAGNPYPTLLEHDGARHIVPAAGVTLFLGPAGDEPDVDADGQPTATADGDDADGNDDEKGVAFTSLLVLGQPATVEVTASAAGLLNAWIDWNQNGVWESPAEQIATDLAVVAGVNPVGFTVPATATLGTTFSRFRLDTAGGLTPTGRALDGEVEDHLTAEVLPAADLSIAKTDSPDPVVAGTPLAYTVTVLNAGPSPAQNVVVTDTLPAGVTFVSTVGCANDPAGVPACNLGNVAVGVPVQFTINATVDSGTLGVITNLASVASDTIDPNSANDSTSEDTTVIAEADLVISKADDIDPVAAGGTLVYTVSVQNFGPSDAQGVVVGDTLPAEVTLVSTAGCAEDPAGVPVCSLGTIPAGMAGQFTATVTVDSVLAAGVDSILNQASVTATTPLVNTGDDATSEATVVTAAPDLAITKDDGGVTSFPGGVIVYTLDFANNGSQGATGVEVTDTVPAETTFNEAASGGAGVWSCADGAPAGTVCTHVVGALDGGGAGTGSVDFGVTVDDPVTPGVFEISNTAEIADDGANGADENPADNSDSDTTPLTLDFGDAPLPDYPTLFADDGARHVEVAGIRLGALIDAEIDGQPTPAADGDDLAGVDDEDGVAFVDPLTAGTTATVEVTASVAGFLNAWVDFNADGDWIDAGEQVFTDQALVAGLNSLGVAVPAGAAPGQTFARFRFDTGGGLGFTGFAADGEVEDYAVQIVAEADLALTKSDVFDPLMAGKTQVYRMLVTNNGPSKATGVQLVDTLPAGVFFLTAEPPAPQCLHAGGIVTCDLGMLDPGATTEVRIVVLVGPENSGTITNAATVSSAVPDPNAANDAASADSQVLPLRAMKALPDVNGNGSSDIAALEAGSLVVRVFDAGTGAVISGAVFQPDFAPIALTTVPSFANSPAPEVVVLARRTTDGVVGVFARDAASGALVANHVLPADFRPFYVAAVPSFGGTPAWEVAVLGRRDSDGLVRVRVIDAKSGALLRQYNQTVQFFPLGFLPVPDFSGNGVWELATVGRRAVNQAVRVSMHDASSGLVVSQWNTNHTFQPTGFGVVTDVNGDGSADFAILGRRNPDGAVREWTRDSRTGTILALFGYPLAWLPLDLGIVPDFAGPLFDEGAALRWRPSPADVRVTLKDSSDGTFLAGRLFDPTFQPLDLEIVPSYASGPADELAVWGERLSDGKQRIFLVDPQTGANLGFIPVP